MTKRQVQQLIGRKKAKRGEYKKNWRNNLTEEEKVKAKSRYRILPEEEENKIRIRKK